MLQSNVRMSSERDVCIHIYIYIYKMNMSVYLKKFTNNSNKNHSNNVIRNNHRVGDNTIPKIRMPLKLQNGIRAITLLMIMTLSKCDSNITDTINLNPDSYSGYNDNYHSNDSTHSKKSMPPTMASKYNNNSSSHRLKIWRQDQRL